VIEGNYLALTDEARAKAVLAKELKLTDPKIVAISYDDFKAQSPVDMRPSVEGAQNVMAQILGPGAQDLLRYLDYGILADLGKDGFFTGLEQKYGKR